MKLNDELGILFMLIPLESRDCVIIFFNRVSVTVVIFGVFSIISVMMILCRTPIESELSIACWLFKSTMTDGL